MYKPMNKGIISPRTGKNTVALVGFSMSTRHLVPYEDTATEIWGINDAYKTANFMKRWDRWFQIHPLDYLATQDNSPRDAEHIEWLKQPHDFPIYMHEHYKDMPASVPYPLNDVCKMLRKRYITSSFGFMMGLAMLEGFQRIELYGFDMKTFSEYAHQKPNTEWMIGLAEGRGFDVLIPPQSTLCKGPIYGYEDLDISFRQEMEYRQMSLEEQVRKDLNEFHKLDGIAETLKELSKEYPELKERADNARQAVELQTATINNTMGREQQTRELTALFDEVQATELKLKEKQNG